MLPNETILSGANDGEFNTKGYSKLKVLESAAGFYLGTMHRDLDGFEEPGSRESGYFGTFQEADDALEEWYNGNTINQR